VAVAERLRELEEEIANLPLKVAGGGETG